MSNYVRSLVAVLALSAVGFAGIVGQEGYTDHAVIPVPGDKPTYGLGSTTRADGSPVKITDTIKPQQAIRLAVRDIGTKEVALRACFGPVAMLYQWEWDAYVDLAYNVGTNAVCQSSIPGKIQRGEYEAACRTILDFKSVQHRDCCAPENQKFCGGICLRRTATTRLCLEGRP